jgi:hypothetical protein
MKIEVDKTYIMIILGVMFLLAGTLVYAYGTSSPSVVGHSRGEIQPPTVSEYSWTSSGSSWSNRGSVGVHDFCALAQARVHDDNKDSRLQGCAIIKNSGEWIRYAQGDGGPTYCMAYCLDW